MYEDLHVEEESLDSSFVSKPERNTNTNVERNTNLAQTHLFQVGQVALFGKSSYVMGEGTN